MARDAGDGNMQGVRAVDRAIEILQCFTPEKAAMSVLEIQQRVPLSRPTLYRLLHTLAQKGMIRAFGEPQRFSLDYGVGRLAHNWTAGIDPIVIGRSIVEDLRAKTNETAALFMLRGDQRLCVLEMAAPHILRISWGMGESQPISSGASGKAIMAFMKPDAVEEALKGVPKTGARKTVSSSLDLIRAQGYAISRGEVFAGAIAIAAPYFDHNHCVIGSIGVFGPSARLDQAWEKQAIRAVIESARELSGSLGHFEDLQGGRRAAEPKQRGKSPDRFA
ncbi:MULTISPECIES: IclR family transcriptional regulator [unclassified Beijerinckia]|uniref:IclR family transcriptional regulator n=1 Tax=unclassified Beijerinckia TaxID=2638183 RepID=UPI00089D4C52|nr:MULTISPECIES: IclR family transcriptional regulator [unclassified Beijerinckia]MDH7796877.1 IclR family acetate operon transcriptional repressor [Beijerinckia sp. GAS462]SEC63362.1 transcriptional regulator, IclR family [Beijerinckia sp. 28-YEA-48]